MGSGGIRWDLTDHLRCGIDQRALHTHQLHSFHIQPQSTCPTSQLIASRHAAAAAAAAAGAALGDKLLQLCRGEFGLERLDVL